MTIYNEIDKKFASVSAAVILLNGERHGTLKFHYSNSGVVTCYLHIHGLQAAKGKASGYGYDKKGASLYQAIKALPEQSENENEKLLIKAFKGCLPFCDSLGVDALKQLEQDLNIQVIFAV